MYPFCKKQPASRPYIRRCVRLARAVKEVQSPMAKYILKRLLRSLLTLFVIITIVFSLLRLMPIEGYFQNYEKNDPDPD